MYSLRYCLVAGASVLLVTGSAAAAADAPQPSDADQGQTVEEVVVTALKRTSTLQETPISMSAVTGDNLAKMGATGIADYFREVPGVNLSQGQGGQSRISVRGVVATGEATTGLYYDETPVTGPSATTQDPGNNAADLNLFDVERVEVLRGPQGTLYGGSSMAGAIRVIFNKPDPSTYGGAVETQGATVQDGGQGYYVKGMGNVPIVRDKLALRIVAYEEERPGWVDNVRLGTQNANHSHSEGYRAILGFTPTDDISINLTHIHQMTRAEDTPGFYARLGDHKTDAAVKTPLDSRLDLTNLTARWSTPIAELTASSSFYEYDLFRGLDLTPPYAPYIGNAFGVIGYQPSTLGSWNRELRLTSKEGGQLQWTVGIYDELRKDHTDSLTVVGDPATGNPYEPFEYIVSRYLNDTLKQLSEFGELSYTPRYLSGLTLTVGARHYAYTKISDGAGTRPNLFTGAAALPYSSQEAKSNGWVYKFNASYKFNPDAMAYASASEGFRPGGANNVPGVPSQFAVYTPDKLWTYEAGVKTSSLGGRLTANGSVFRTDWTNRQTTTFTPDGIYAYMANVGNARLTGFELETAARPMTGLTVTASLAYVDGKVTSEGANAALLVTSDQKGDKLTGAPDWTATLSANYTWPVGDTMNGLVRADYAYTGSMATYQPGYVYYTKYGNFSTVNLRTGLEGSRWGAYLFINNLTNANGVLSELSGVGYADLLYGISPRTFGVNVRKSF